MDSEVPGYTRNGDYWILNNTDSNIKLTLNSDGRGRCFISPCAYKRGDIVLCENPYAMVVTSPYSECCCAYCGHVPESNKVYGVHQSDPQRYCSEACMAKDQKTHKLETKAFQLLRELGIEGGMDACSLVLRIAALRSQEPQSSGARQFPLLGRSNLFEHVMSLEAATGSMEESSLEQILQVASAIADIADDCDLPLSIDEANHLFLAIQCNAHCIRDGKERSVALGVFPMTSMLNHSCDPNCSHSFTVTPGCPPALVMRALRDISPGEELCYNYIPLYQSTALRQAQLLSAYSFTCRCRRCMTASVTSPPTDDENSFPVDDVLSLSSDAKNSGRASFRCSSEVATCSSLLSTAISSRNLSAINSVVKKLVAFCASETKAGAIHPCNEILLTAYVTIAKGSAQLLADRDHTADSVGPDTVTTEHRQQQIPVLAGLGFSVLALGCLQKYTKVRNGDISELEEIASTALKHLDVNALPNTTNSQQLEHDRSILSSLVASGSDNYTKNEFIDVVALVVTTCLRQLSYYYEGDPRVTELLHIASRNPSSYFVPGKTMSETFSESSLASKMP